MNALRSNRVVRLSGGDESGAALITALLAILVTAMFAIVMLGVLLSQTMPTKLEQATTRTVFAAEAGINATVAQLRNVPMSPDALGNIYGNRKMLPCDLTGKVSNAGSDSVYSVTIRYYIEDPTHQSDAWRSSGANVLTCTTGLGTQKIPAFALIESTGTGLSVANAPGDLDRKIEAVYAFKVTSNNIPGGHIYSWNASDNKKDFCLQATGTVAGSNVKYVNADECGANEPVQLWVYDKNLRIQLASTTVPGYVGDILCISGTPTAGTAVKVTLEKCADTTSASRWKQMWAWDGSASWRQSNNTISGTTNFFLNSGKFTAVTAGTLLYVWDQNPGQAGWGAYDPQAAVGAGRASYDTHEIVNALQFGRCADVTSEDINKDYMIAFPCKQDPAPDLHNLAWNHKWFYNEPSGNVGTAAAQLIKVYDQYGTLYCLKSPGVVGGFPIFEKGCSVADKHFAWKRTAFAVNFDSSYTFTDGYGLCLAVDPTDPMPGQVWARLKVLTCDDGLAQKWNAPPSETSGELGNYWETN